jgi:AraC-like DNA-binding protein
MTNTLTRFGRYCRDARASQGKNMATQADSLGHKVSEISLYETGIMLPPDNYIDELAEWLGLDSQELRKRAPRDSTVIAFPRKRHANRSVRLFRKISRMTPAQIRALGSDRDKGVPYE